MIPKYLLVTSKNYLVKIYRKNDKISLSNFFDIAYIKN